MKRVKEEERKTGIYFLISDWELIGKKIKELNMTEDEAEKIKKAILLKEGEHLKNQ